MAKGKIVGVFLKGKTWNLPEGALKPERKTKGAIQASQLLSILKEEKQNKRNGGVYHKIQVDLTFNSNHIEEASLLTNKSVISMRQTP